LFRAGRLIPSEIPLAFLGTLEQERGKCSLRLAEWEKQWHGGPKMANEQRRFLKMVKEAWEKEFPFLEPVDLHQVPKPLKGSTFRCDKYFEERAVCYFVHFCFSKKIHSKFTVHIKVSPSPNKSFVPLEGRREPGPTAVGSYNLSKFLKRQTYTWSLLDGLGKLDESYVSLGFEPLFRNLPERNPELHWKPSSFALPFEEICVEAIQDLNDKLRRFVFPKLEIALPKK
jgi:hypothetical protein